MFDLDGTHMKIQIPLEFKVNSDLEEELQEGLAKLLGEVAVIRDDTEVVVGIIDDPAGLGG